MAFTDLTVITSQRETPVVSVWTDIGAGGVRFKNTGKEIVIVQRDTIATSTVTFHTNTTVDGVVLGDLTLAMAAGNVTKQFVPVGPFPTGTYNQTSGWVEITSTDANDMVTVIQLNKVD